MKICLPLIAVILLEFVALAQGMDPVIYFPDGRIYSGRSRTISELSYEFEEYGRVFVFTPFSGENDYATLVGFKLFTNKPLWVITDDSTKITRAIESFSLSSFISSGKFESELDYFMEKGKITDVFILETLGKPDKEKKFTDKLIPTECWEYHNIGIKFTLKQGIVTCFIKE